MPSVKRPGVKSNFFCTASRAAARCPSLCSISARHHCRRRPDCFANADSLYHAGALPALDQLRQRRKERRAGTTHLTPIGPRQIVSWIAVGKVSGSDPESVFAAERY
jgi:hypothetical protein